MAVVIYPITPRFAAEIGDVDLSCPIGPSDLAAVNEAFAEYAVLIFPDQHLSQDQHLDFAKHTSDRLRPPLPFIERVRRCACAKSLRMCPTSTTKTMYGARKADSACFSWATGFGTPIARSNGCRRGRRGFMRARFHRSADIRSLLTSGRHTTRCRRKPSAASTRSSQSIRS